MPLLLSPPTPQRSSPGLRGSGYELLSVVVDQAPADPRLVVGVRRVTSALDVDVDVDHVFLVVSRRGAEDAIAGHRELVG